MAVPIIGAEAVAEGLLTRAQLRHRYAPVFRGVYLPKGHSPTLFERIAAARLAVPRAVIAGPAASAVHGAKWVDDDIRIDLIGRCRPQPGLRGREETLCADESMTVRGIPVTTPARTAFDLARRLPRADAIERLDALMNASPFSIEDAMLLTKVHPRARGLVRAREALPFVDGGAESPKESWLRMLFIDAGLPVPTTQFVVYRADGVYIRRIDMVWEDYKIGAEYDGEQHLTSREQYARDVWTRGELQKLGWYVIHVIKEHRGPDVVAEGRAALLARGWDGRP
ncbi:hypothetical protein [Mycolicibacterium diernhoferi]|uniref:DUF559 domain-containing protein n=1 Tax=Mycolicibacterium diernhoferi TaxID=1801 RepID=A0A1Q4HBV9_9MYCO|nr:hypothetical protein [Mycolicibacterium diernhoferi]OJZ65039.1 hypothetical protein BRW64_14415 [Mycolicibacterium diernhoferi]OPE49083.1 hypothetical protein BV510_22725 [Mycolicibacterium diernhoferi]PEG52235.1 hypothetical protein CRI78_22180 [Mycolicibacterium diernhoferi]QYL23753.1 hypothetical protein K0O62_05480 [Mycolicibacterium diernhoferi]